jgi:hypothetical protein
VVLGLDEPGLGGGEAVGGGVEPVGGGRNLPEVVLAADAVGGGADPLDGGQHESQPGGQDGGDDRQFD